MEDDIIIGNEGRKHPLEDYMEREFYKGWKSYIKGIIDENKRSNIRLFKILSFRKENQFLKDVKGILKTVGGTCRVQITRNPEGMMLSDKRWKSFPVIWVNQKQSSLYGSPQGTLCVRVDDKRYLSFHYYLKK